jgi:hypothetical protein
MARARARGVWLWGAALATACGAEAAPSSELIEDDEAAPIVAPAGALLLWLRNVNRIVILDARLERPIHFCCG